MLYVRGYVRSTTPRTSNYLHVLGDFRDATSESTESNPFAGQISKHIPTFFYLQLPWPFVRLFKVNTLHSNTN